MNFNYKKLKLKIKEVYDTQDAFAKALGMGVTIVNQRLNNAVKWKSTEIVEVCNLLEIPIEEAYLYFFIPEV
jgi:hypothetical protein